jgi:hypothetical protein
MKKDDITDPDNWYYDGPEDGSSLREVTHIGGTRMHKHLEDIVFRAFGQEGVDRLNLVPTGQTRGV